MPRFPSIHQFETTNRHIAMYIDARLARGESSPTLKPVSGSQSPAQHRVSLESVHLIYHRKEVVCQSDSPLMPRSPRISVRSGPGVPLMIHCEGVSLRDLRPVPIEESSQARHLIVTVELGNVMSCHARQSTRQMVISIRVSPAIAQKIFS